MQEVDLEFIEKIKRTESVSSFRFRPNVKIHFLPGQFLQLFFDRDEKDNRYLNKYLSFSSSPDKDYVEVTKRLSDSSFSRKLLSLKKGYQVMIRGPMGNCVFNEGLDKFCFLAGGIGITPVISIIEHIALNSLKNDIHLLYSNRCEDDIAFKDELDNWSKKFSNIKVNYLVIGQKSQKGGLHKGVINKGVLTDLISDFCQRRIFIFGPPAMVAATRNICYDIGCINESVCTENFIGY